MSGVIFKVLQVHAGTSERDIVTFVEQVEAIVTSKDTATQTTTKSPTQQKTVWAFLDEINTCEHLALINDIVCHRMCFGRPIHHHVIFLAACNPYKFRQTVPRPIQNTSSTPVEEQVGFSGKIHWDEKAKLVYRVEPLPERYYNRFVGFSAYGF